MKKQTFEILPVSPEERKHLIGLSYNEIGDVLQAKDSLSLISYLNSNSVKIAEMAIITLKYREDFWNIVEGWLPGYKSVKEYLKDFAMVVAKEGWNN